MKIHYPITRRRILWIMLFAVLVILVLSASTSYAAPEQSCGFYHRVSFGQTLYSISVHYGVSVQSIMKANPHIKNPNLIYAGSKVFIPCTGGHGTGGSCSHVHYVQYGQTLSQIAWKYHVSPHAIMRANSIQNPNLIYAGTSLCIP